jgi:hypothetical protein
MEMSTYRERENKKEKTHQHKREEHITQKRKRPSVEQKGKYTAIERDIIHHLTNTFPPPMLTALR